MSLLKFWKDLGKTTGWKYNSFLRDINNCCPIAAVAKYNNISTENSIYPSFSYMGYGKCLGLSEKVSRLIAAAADNQIINNPTAKLFRKKLIKVLNLKEI